jgi:hypothetical protein
VVRAVCSESGDSEGTSNVGTNIVQTITWSVLLFISIPF